MTHLKNDVVLSVLSLCVARDQPAESRIGVVGNKKVTSKRDYMYQQLDGEASISCH